MTPMSCVQVFAVPAVPVPDERSWQSYAVLESAELDAIVFPDVPASKKIPRSGCAPVQITVEPAYRRPRPVGEDAKGRRAMPDRHGAATPARERSF